MNYTIVSIALFLCVMGAGCKKEGAKITPTAITFTKEGELWILKPSGDTIQRMDIEIAASEYETQTGLMYRKSMEQEQGMLFITEKMRKQSFYMKNTLIPLDIIYIDDALRIVSIQENAKPLDETPLPSGVPAQYTLEINAGLVAAWGIVVGDQIVYDTFSE